VPKATPDITSTVPALILNPGSASATEN